MRAVYEILISCKYGSRHEYTLSSLSSYASNAIPTLKKSQNHRYLRVLI